MNPAEQALRRVDRYQQRHPWIGVPFAVVKKFGDDKGGNLTTLVAYNGFFALLPLLLVLVTLLGYPRPPASGRCRTATVASPVVTLASRRPSMATGVQVVFDCADPDRLARFWAEALGYRLQDPPEGYGSWEDWLRDQNIPEERWNDAGAVVDPDGKGPRIYFQRVPEAKTVKNRVHLDLNISGGPSGGPLEERRRRVDAEVERLLGLGATRQRAVEELGGYWVVMQDPEGNEFCVH